MEVEISFSGLCSFLNVRNTNATMPEPSLILVRTDDVQPEGLEGGDAASLGRVLSPGVAAALDRQKSGPRDVIDAEKSAAIKRGNGKGSGKAGDGAGSGNGAGVASDVHIPYIAFNTDTAVVNDLAGFSEPDLAPRFMLLPLNGVEIVIQNDPPALPRVHDSYDLVVKKDHYWPAAKDQWNRDFVPVRGNKPKKSAVVGFMRFGSGMISSGRLSPRPWKFERAGMAPLVGVFAEEVIYSDFPHSGDDIVIELRDLETGALIRDPLRFSPKSPDQPTMTIFIGNNDPDDVDNAVHRLAPSDVPDNDHFRFLNRVAAIPDPGVIPTVVRQPNPPPVVEAPVGGLSSGPCGPTSSNG